MDDQTSNEMTPEEARVRLRQAATRLESMSPLRKYTWQIVAGAVGAGVILGYFPGLRRGAIHMLGMYVGRTKRKPEQHALATVHRGN